MRWQKLLELVKGPSSFSPLGPRSPNFKAVFTLVSSAVILTLLNFIVLSGRFQGAVAQMLREAFSTLPDGLMRAFLLELSPLYRHMGWSMGCFFFYFLAPAAIVRLVFREPLSAYGLMPKGFIRHAPLYLALYAPVALAVFAVSFTEAFQYTYPFYHDPFSYADLLIWEFFYCIQFFALEFFFRGFLVHATKEKFGTMSVFVMVVPYCMIHFQKPMAEALAAILAGIVLGFLSLRTNTIWGGVAIHCAVAVTMDLTSLWQRGWEPQP